VPIAVVSGDLMPVRSSTHTSRVSNSMRGSIHV
jgi:hypothetical protein